MTTQGFIPMKDGQVKSTESTIFTPKVVKLKLPTDCRISSTYMEKNKVWNWHFANGVWVNSKDKDGFGFHKGIDFACPIGSPIKACVDGKILKVGYEDDLRPPNDKGFGLRIIQIFEQAGDKWLLYYGHLSEVCMVKGEGVTKGKLIA